MAPWRRLGAQLTLRRVEREQLPAVALEIVDRVDAWRQIGAVDDVTAGATNCQNWIKTK
jgi:hypothetical protein